MFQTSSLLECLSCFQVWGQPGQGPQGPGWGPVLPVQAGGRNCLSGGWALLCSVYSLGHMGRTPSSALRSLLSEQTKLGIIQPPDANSKPGGYLGGFQSILGILIKVLSLSSV